jgi:kynureninase
MVESMNDVAHLGSIKDAVSETAKTDAADPLAHLRQEFNIPQRTSLLHGHALVHTKCTVDNGKDCIYLCGNSLGLQPKRVQQLLSEDLQVWAERGVEGHFDHPYGRPWLTVDEECCRLMAPIVGADESEIAIMTTLSTNLHLLLNAFYLPTQHRHKILIEDKAFPSDYFIVESQIATHGFNPKESLLIVKPKEGEETVREQDIVELIEAEGDQIAVVMLAGVQFLSGQLFPIEAITRIAQAKVILPTYMIHVHCICCRAAMLVLIWLMLQGTCL